MKISHFRAVVLMVLTLSPAFGQTPAQPTATTAARSPDRLNLDFPGGTPRQLVAAIQKATGKTLNVIVPDEAADVKLPPLKMSDVDIGELFSAIEMAGRASPVQQYGFSKSGKREEVDSVWTFYAARRPTSAKVCRFYSLSPFLERGLSVDDITTAIQTGWNMLGDKDPPAISFHKDTKLLIAVGEPGKLETINAALAALAPASDIAWSVRPPSEEPKSKLPAEKKSGK